MRFIAIATVLFAFAASTALAVNPPGPPPWRCSLVAACNASDTCIFLRAFPIRFDLTQVEGGAKKYHLEGYDGFEKAALELPSLADAEQLAKTYRAFEPIPFILIRNNKIADTNSFWLHTIAWRGNGQPIMTEEKMLVGCNSIL